MCFCWVAICLILLSLLMDVMGLMMTDAGASIEPNDCGIAELDEEEGEEDEEGRGGLEPAREEAHGRLFAFVVELNVHSGDAPLAFFTTLELARMPVWERRKGQTCSC